MLAQRPVARPGGVSPRGGRPPIRAVNGGNGTVRDQPVVRLAGLPASVLARLRFTDTSALVARVLAGREWLTREGDGLSGLLYDAIGVAGDDALKPRLVGLRRALHRMRPPAPTEWGSELQAALPPELSGRVQGWLERLHGWRRDCARLPRVLADEARRQEEVLRSIVSDPGFQRALWQSSAPLAGELDKWLADPARRPRRQSVARLAKYVSRAATKTSPNSTFSVTGLGAWSSTGPAVRLNRDTVLHAVLEPYGQLRDGVVDALVRQPGLGDSTRVRVNPSVIEQEGRLSFLGRGPAEPLVTLPATAAVRTCIDIIGSGQTATLGGLREHLAATSGAAASAIARFLSHLVEVGLLETSPPVPGDGRTVEQLASWVASCGGDELADVARSLHRLAGDLAEPVPVTDVPGHRARQESLRGHVATLTDRLDIGSAVGGGGRLIAHDSVVCAGQVVQCGMDGWRPALDDLELIRRWLAVLNPVLPLQLALSEFWRTRFGPGAKVPFLDLHRAVQEEVSGDGAQAVELRRILSTGAYRTATGVSEVPKLRELGRLRSQALQPFRRQAQGNPDVVRVDPAILAGIASGWPPWVGSISSLSCYVQPLPPDHEVGLVVNLAGTGYGRGWSRLVHLLTLAGQRPPVGGTAAEPGTGPQLAELAGPNGSTLNDREPSVPYEIDYPFTGSSRRSQQRLPLSDLVVDRDPHREVLRLHSIRLGTEVRALDLGLLMLPALPPAARLLVQAFGETATLAFTSLPQELPPPLEVRKRPRVVAGRVVLRRASWVVRSAAVPRRIQGETDPDYLLRLTGWLRAAQVPPRCFVRALPAAGSTAVDLFFDKARKPVYIDFSNWFLVLAFENMLRSPADLVVFEEALPDPEEATEPTGAPRVVEFLIEIGEREG